MRLSTFEKKMNALLERWKKRSERQMQKHLTEINKAEAAGDSTHFEYLVSVRFALEMGMSNDLDKLLREAQGEVEGCYGIFQDQTREEAGCD